jgi:hypothetical protein
VSSRDAFIGWVCSIAKTAGTIAGTFEAVQNPKVVLAAVVSSLKQVILIVRRCQATFAAADRYKSMHYNIAIGYDTAGLFFVSSSNVPGLKVQARSFKEVVERATITSRRLLCNPSADITFERGIMVRNTNL